MELLHLNELEESNAAAKLIVKKWEDTYKKNYGSRPSKEALHQAPNEIKDAYKTYWRSCKHLALAKNEASSFNKTHQSSHQEDLPKLSKSFSHDLNNSDINGDDGKIVDESKPEVGTIPSSIPKAIWGQHLNKRNVCNETVNLELSLYSKMAENMKSHAVIKTRTSLKRPPGKTLNDSTDKIKNPPISSEATEVVPKIALENSNLKDISNCLNSNSRPLDEIKIFEDEGVGLNSTKNVTFIVKKSVPKVNSQPVCHLSLDPTTKGKKASTRHWNEGWVRRCSSIVEDLDLTRDQMANLKRDEIVSNETVHDSASICTDNTKDNLIHMNNSPVHKQKEIPSISTNYEINLGNSVKRKLTEVSEFTNNCAKRLKPIEMDSEKCEDISSKNESRKIDSVYLFDDDDDDDGEWKVKPVKKTDLCGSQNNLKPKYRRKMSNQSGALPQESYKKLPRKRRIISKNEAEENTCSKNEDLEEGSGNIIEKSDQYDELDDMENKKPIKNISTKKYYSKEERFHHKILSGKANDNFVKINLKKKIFVRGKKRMTSQKYKRQEWKNKQIMKSAENGDERAVKKLTCFRCGDFGHWANKCPGKIGDSLLPVTEYDENEGTFLTIEEAADLAKGIKSSSDEVTTRIYSRESNEQSAPSQGNISEDEVFSDWEDDFISAVDVEERKHTETDALSTDEKNEESSSTVHPLYKMNSEGMLMTTPAEVKETLKLFGHNAFRRGQEEAIMRILSGHSTLVVQSTGSGKSLCYQLPAYLYSQHFKCITICVSPLVSLMEDQVTGLPPFLKAVCLHTQQSSGNREKALNALRSGNVHILLVSPEAIVSSSGGGVLGTLLKELPPIAFVCLDEAHCVSEWSHNFRPSYLQVCRILKERLHVNTFLGLTATARNETAISIAKQLRVPSLDRGVIMGTCIPDNLMLSVSRDANREVALIHLLTGSRFEDCSSIIIYCTRREECERIATFIRTQMVTASRIDVKSNSKRQRGISLDAEAYHAGLSGYRRQQIQKRFMSGKLRIVVATVAFGMGIDKADVQGIIHFNMPRNLESYVQEIGRAGRDGNIAHCHLFLDSSDGKDIQELKRHIFVNSVDRFMVRKLLNKVFVARSCAKTNKLINPSNTLSNKEISPKTNFEKADDDKRRQSDCEDARAVGTEFKKFENSYQCPGHEVALPIDELIEYLDLPEENIQTLLCYLETHPRGRLKLSHHVYATSKVSCYRGPKQLCAISRKCPPLAIALALQRKRGKNFDKISSVTFPVVDIASQMGWESRIVKQELKRLEWDTDTLKIGGTIRASGVKVEFCDLAFHMTCRCDLAEQEQDEVLEDIFERACTQEKDQLKQLQYIYEVLRKSSNASIILCCDAVDEEKSSALKETISSYFSACNEGGLSSVHLEEQLYIRPEAEQRIRTDIRSMLSIHSDQSWTGRSVARVLHGISSPNFPSKVWGRVRKFWRLHLETDFNLLVAIATKEILKFK